MRLPVNKVYRAFPELDRFSDSECERYVERVLNDHPLEQLGVGVVGLAVGGCCVWVVLAVGIELDRKLGRAPGWQVGFMWVTVALTAAAGATVSGLSLRDWWLRTRLRRHLSNTTCGGCRYSLLGLDVVDGRVSCPECGQVLHLVDRGLTAADLMSPRA